MSNFKSLLSLILIVFFLFFPIISVLATQAVTTMTWFVPANKVFTVAYGGTCSSTAFFFDENSALVDGDIDGNGSQIAPRPNRLGGTVCQDSSTAGITITNAGNTSFNVDANFAGNIDTNLWLKVWMGNGSGCGTNGMGGWAIRCTVVSTTAPVTSSTCKDFNSSNETVTSRLVNSLPVGDTNQLCFSGDFLAEIQSQTAAVAQGDHNGSFQISSDTS